MIELLESILKPVVILGLAPAVILERLFIFRSARRKFGLSRKQANSLSRHILLGGKSDYVSLPLRIYVVPANWAGLLIVLLAIFFSTSLDGFLFIVGSAIYIFILTNFIFLLSASFHLGFEGDVKEMVGSVGGEAYLAFLYKNVSYSLSDTPRWLGRLSGTLWWVMWAVLMSAILGAAYIIKQI